MMCCPGIHISDIPKIKSRRCKARKAKMELLSAGNEGEARSLSASADLSLTLGER
jgi:hypothetical protein